MTVARRITVKGRVQGVFFRAWTKEQADQLGVSGWVRNCDDGSDEALVAGEASAVEAMIERMRRGPSSSKVEQLIEGVSGESACEEFLVRH